MADNGYLGGLEETVLLAVQHLGENAYGAIIHTAMNEVGRSISIGSLYITLGRLENKGFLKSRLGDATPERGGKVKKFYTLTGEGALALHEAEQRRNKLSLIARALQWSFAWTQ